MTEKRRKRGIVARLVDDPWRKLLAIVLAVLAWYFVNSRINHTLVRFVDLHTLGARSASGIEQNRLAVVLPTDRVVGHHFYDGDQEIKRVAIAIGGPRFKVEEWKDKPLDLQITSFVGMDWTGRKSIEFTVADLPRDLRLQDLRIEMQPPRIRLDVESYSKTEFTLTLDSVDIDPGQLSGRLRMETAKFTPDTAVLVGPAIGLDQFARTQNKRFRATMKSAGDDRFASAQLELIDATALRLQLETPPLLTIQVLPQTTRFELELPILVDDVGLPPELRGRYRPDSPKLTVRIAAGGELRVRLVNLGENGDTARVAAWAAANLRLLVHVPPPEPGAPQVAELDRPARLSLVGRLYETVERNEALLDEPVLVKLRLK